jgi:L-ribulose-5-phosphate 3-epimerase
LSGRIGVCSWSLSARNPGELVTKMRAVGVRYAHLALGPLRQDRGVEASMIEALRNAEFQVPAGMMAFRGEDYSSLDSIRRTGGVALDEHWETNRRAAREIAALAARNSIPLVTFHAGFIPHETGADRRTILGRLREIADILTDQGVRAAFETGQETAATLLSALEELHRPGVGVNFDPANMILYGMGDPVEALRLLAQRVAQVHIKDAIPSTIPGTWGKETVAGTGSVDWPAFFAVLEERRIACDFMIEREAGENRAPDILAARKIVERYFG